MYIKSVNMLFAYATDINDLIWSDSMNINDGETHIFLLLDLMIVFYCIPNLDM